jgi:TPR repeat protein
MKDHRIQAIKSCANLRESIQLLTEQMMKNNNASGSMQGGDGGAIVEPGIWTHYRLRDIGISELVKQVVSGEKSELTLPAHDVLAKTNQASDMFLLYLLLRKKQPAEALAWARKAAETGHLAAQFALTSNREVSAAERADWLMLVAARLEDDSRIKTLRYRLATKLREGDGSESNPAAEALLLLQNCNDRFHAGGAARLAKLYYEGHELKQDPVKALMWAILASCSGIDVAPHGARILDRRALMEHSKFVEEIRNGLSREQIQRAEKLAKECFGK